MPHLLKTPGLVNQAMNLSPEEKCKITCVLHMKG